MLIDRLRGIAGAVAGGLAVIDVGVRVDRVHRLAHRAGRSIGVHIMNCTIRSAVHRLIDRASRSVGVDVRVAVGRGVLVDVGHRPRIDVLVNVGVRAGRHVVIVVRGRAGAAGDRIVVIGGRSLGQSKRRDQDKGNSNTAHINLPLE